MTTTAQLTLRDRFLAHLTVDELSTPSRAVLERDGEVILERHLSPGASAETVFRLDSVGTYRSRVLSSEGHLPELAVSNAIHFHGFNDIGLEPRVTRDPLVIVGVTRFAASARRILDRKFEVVGFETQDGARRRGDFCGLPVLDHLGFGLEPKRIVVDELTRSLTWRLNSSGAEWELVLCTARGSNLLLSCVDRLSIYEAHRLAHDMGVEGLTEGAGLIQGRIYLTYNCSLPYALDLDPSVKFGYGGIGVVIHKDAQIGRDVKIGQNVTIGARNGVVASIGDNSWIGPGAMVLGATIGEGVTVGANSVVIHDVKSGSTVVSPLARVLSQYGSSHVPVAPATDKGDS